MVKLNVLILLPLGLGQTKSGGQIFEINTMLFSLFFSFPSPPRREEKTVLQNE
jgi:hypothetical protein